MTFNDDQGNVRYRVGIDVGTNSTGFCAVEVDENGFPQKILNSLVYVHDSGLDPDGKKTATTRKAASGVARRMRRLVRRRAKRLQELDTYLESLGWPLVDLEKEKDPYFPWRVRAQLLRQRVSDDDLRQKMLSVAVCHMARHRGWRSPYSRTESLLQLQPASDLLIALRERVEEVIGFPMEYDAYPAQIVDTLLTYKLHQKMRGPQGILGGKLMQSDNAAEILEICSVQGVAEETTHELVLKIFAAQSARGSARGRVAKDALPGQGAHPRAERAHPAFQKFRIVSVLANLRISEGGTRRVLTRDELEGLTDFLMSDPGKDNPTWQDVAENLGVDRADLHGTAAQGPDGAPASAQPPIDVTNQKICALKKIPALVAWWKEADDELRGAFVDACSNVGSGEDSAASAIVDEFLSERSEDELAAIEGLNLTGGRSAYSVDSLQRLTRVMLEECCDLHEARKKEFGVDDSWTPPAEPINGQTGNPAVDRVTKQVARWLSACERRWGAPEAINIEHVRSALGSERMARELMSENRRREAQNLKIIDAMNTHLGIGKARPSDVIRYRALTRQNGQCLYCGTPITFQTLEMDHIVPRKNSGSTNTRTNLAAVCRSCNLSKSNIPFAVWAGKSENPNISLAAALKRVRGFIADPDMRGKEAAKFKKAVADRLKATKPDAEFDGRSMESVAWMANELRHRIENHFKRSSAETRVCVYRGALTAEARKASKFEGRVNLIGGGGKTRFDRRHHAMDALTIALMREGISQTLALRINMRESQYNLGTEQTWKQFTGASEGARRTWEQWSEGMLRASELFNIALNEDAIPIVENSRLRFGSGKVHEDSMRPLMKLPLGEELSVEMIDRAATPALWCALTRHPGFDAKKGLPADPHREIHVNGRRITGEEKIDFFPTGAACIAVRGGYCELGSSFHHSRIYRMWTAKGKEFYGQVRVYQVDLVKHQKEDLFSVELPPQSISVRTAEPKVREALVAGRCEYIGWLVVGDEIEVDISSFSSGAISELAEAYPMCTRWKVAGFKEPDVVRLRPRLLSAEGIPEESPKGIQEIVSGQGWRPAVNKLFSNHSVRIIRRTALGEERWHKHGSLPSSFEVDGR